MLARLPGTAALSFLLDQGVFRSQRLPLHCAFVSSTKQCARAVTLVKPRHSDACAVLSASSTTVLFGGGASISSGRLSPLE